ncbi:unnamed protein product [Urochloa humidicola]
MCSAEFSRADCSRCLAVVSSSTDGLGKLCPSSATVAAIFDPCMVRYSNHSFLGTAETDVVRMTINITEAYGSDIQQLLGNLSVKAATSPQRFAKSDKAPYALVQCTRDLPSDKCQACIDSLLANSLDKFQSATEGELKSFSCRVRYSNPSVKIVAAAPSSSPPSSNNRRRLLTAGRSITIGAVTGGTLIVILGLVAVRRQCRILINRLLARHRLLSAGVTRGGPTAQLSMEVHYPRVFKRAELSITSNDFSGHDKLGSGQFGDVYKSKLQESGELVAVKRIKIVNEEAKKEYIREIDVISQLRHRNLVLLKGWCDERGDLLLVYEFMENGSLDAHLHRPTTDAEQCSWAPLGWKRRCNIIRDIASGLAYLHEGREQCVMHRDIKPANVLLDGSFTAKLADFGLARQVSHEGTSHAISVDGSLCYMEPNYIRTKTASKASDVYSFGVLMLEILTGEEPTTPPTGGDENTLVKKVRELDANNQILEAADRALEYVDREVVTRMLKIALRCVDPQRQCRPTITQVITSLDNGSVPGRPAIVSVLSPREFTHAQLSQATKEFSDKLGNGTFGEVFKGKLEESGELIAVKRVYDVNDQSKKEYVTEIKIISQLRHRNLVLLKGWCNDGDKLLLVYEFMENGSLAALLYPPTAAAGQRSRRVSFDWEKRHRIIVGLASGLAYLHEGGEKGIIHRDIKPANVLLDESFTAKLGDFGLVSQIDHEESARTMAIGGTWYYMDPDYRDSGKASKESDVYSFGIVLLEILCRQKPKLEANQNSLIKMVSELHDTNIILQAADKALLTYVDKELIKRMLWVALLCVRPDRRNRPSSTRVLAYLTGDARVPEPPRSVVAQHAQEQGPGRPSLSRQHSDTYRTAPSVLPVTPSGTLQEH